MRPTATLSALKKRADIIHHIRQFFRDRHLLEVDTPLLSHATVTDPHVVGIPAIFKQNGLPEKTLYLQTSPEYAMKRLLTAGSGSIFQLCKAFRQGDLGKVHHPEFTILEWYRLGFNHHQLMDETDELLQTVLHTQPAERMSYAALFEKFLNLNPHTTNTEELMQCARNQSIQFVTNKNEMMSRDAWLMLLSTHCIEPHIGKEKPIFIYDFPVTQAALAKIRHEENPPVASRFEVYFKGLELANGFHELQNADEQRKRFEADQLFRRQHEMPHVEMDEHFLAALEAGLPDCSGVALGVDRLVMIALNAASIDEVISFGFG